MALTYINSYPDTTDTNQYTYSVSFGTASADRYIIVTASARKAGASTTITGVTIGGITATQVHQNTNTSTNTDVSGIFIAAVPTGTTGDVVVTYGATMVRSIIGVYAATSLASATAYDTAGYISTSDPTNTLDIPAGGFAVAIALTNSAGTTTWTGLTEDFDGTLETFVTYSGASDEFAEAQTGLTITANFSGATTEAVASFASWAVSSGATTVSVNNQAKANINSTVSRANYSRGSVEGVGQQANYAKASILVPGDYPNSSKAFINYPKIMGVSLSTHIVSRRRIAVSQDGVMYYVGVQDYGGTYDHIFVYTSSDGGLTWSEMPGQPISASVGNYVQAAPSVAVGTDGVVHVAWYGKTATDTAATVHYNSYNGSVWSGVEAVHAVSNQWQDNVTIALDYNNKPHLIMSGWDSGPTYTEAKIFYSNKISGSWTAWEYVCETQLGDRFQDFPDITITQDGTVHVSFTADDADYGISDWQPYYTYKPSGGSWATAIKLLSADIQFQTTSITHSHCTQHVYVAAADWDDGYNNEHIYVAKDTGSGMSTFSSTFMSGDYWPEDASATCVGPDLYIVAEKSNGQGALVFKYDGSSSSIVQEFPSTSMYTPQVPVQIPHRVGVLPTTMVSASGIYALLYGVEQNSCNSVAANILSTSTQNNQVRANIVRTVVVGEELIDQQYDHTNWIDVYDQVYGTGWWASQEFVPTKDNVSKIEVYMAKSSGATAPITFGLYDDDGGDPGTLLRSYIIDPHVVPLAGSDAYITIDLLNVTLVAGNKYHLTFKSEASTTTGYLICIVNHGGVGGYTSGAYEYSENQGSTWNDATSYDLIFRQYYIARWSYVRASIVGASSGDNYVRANILASKSYNNSTKANIVVSKPQTNRVIANISVATNKANDTRANLVSSQTKSNSSKGTIQRSGSYANYSRANILVYGLTRTNTVVGYIYQTGNFTNSVVADIQSTYPQTTSVVANIRKSELVANAVVAAIQASRSYGNATLANISGSSTRANNVVASIVVSESRENKVLANLVSTKTVNNSAKANIQKPELKSNATRAVIEVSGSQSQAVRANIFNSQTVSNSSIAFILAAATANNYVRGNISIEALEKTNSVIAALIGWDDWSETWLVNVSRDNYVRANIERVETKDNQSLAWLLNIVSKEVNVKAWIQKAEQIANSVKVDILNTYSQGNYVRANLSTTETTNNEAKAHLVVYESRNNLTRANIAVTNQALNYVKAHIRLIASKNNDVVANIKAPQLKDNQVKASVEKTGEVVQYARANILKYGVTYNQSTRACIQITYEKENSVKGYIVRITSNHHYSLANIVVTVSDDQVVKATIEQTESYQNTTLGNIQRTREYQNTTTGIVEVSNSYVNSTKARIEKSESRNNAVTANIKRPYEKGNQVLVNIETPGRFNNSAVANITRTGVSHYHSALGNILNTYSADNFVGAQLAITYSYANQVTARLSEVYYQDNLVKGYIYLPRMIYEPRPQETKELPPYRPMGRPYSRLKGRV